MNLRRDRATCHFVSGFPEFFERDIKELERKYPKVRKDLGNLVTKIEQDYRRVANARRMPGFDDREVWKYRGKSSDQVRGGRGGFRLIVLVEDGIATPLAMHAKTQREDVPTNQIRRRINSLER